jgi:hypothetical protein
MTNDRSDRRTTPLELPVDSDSDELSSELESDEIVPSEGRPARGEGGCGEGGRGEARGDKFGGLRGAR